MPLPIMHDASLCSNTASTVTLWHPQNCRYAKMPDWPNPRTPRWRKWKSARMVSFVLIIPLWTAPWTSSSPQPLPSYPNCITPDQAKWARTVFWASGVSCCKSCAGSRLVILNKSLAASTTLEAVCPVNASDSKACAMKTNTLGACVTTAGFCLK